MTSNQDAETRFPIMGGPSIPWRWLTPHETQAKKNHGGQDLVTLYNRGGLSPQEALDVLEDRRSVFRDFTPENSRLARDELQRRIDAEEGLPARLNALEQSLTAERLELSNLRAEFAHERQQREAAEAELVNAEALRNLAWTQRFEAENERDALRLQLDTAREALTAIDGLDFNTSALADAVAIARAALSEPQQGASK